MQIDFEIILKKYILFKYISGFYIYFVKNKVES